MHTKHNTSDPAVVDFGDATQHNTTQPSSTSGYHSGAKNLTSGEAQTMTAYTREEAQRIVDHYRLLSCGPERPYCDATLGIDTHGNYFILREHRGPEHYSSVIEIGQKIAQSTEDEYIPSVLIELGGLKVVTTMVGSDAETTRFYNLPSCQL